MAFDRNSPSDQADLHLLLESLSARLGLSLTLLDGSGWIVATSNAWLANEQSVVDSLAQLATQSQLLDYDRPRRMVVNDCQRVVTRFFVSGQELTLVTGGYRVSSHPTAEAPAGVGDCERLLPLVEAIECQQLVQAILPVLRQHLGADGLQQLQAAQAALVERLLIDAPPGERTPAALTGELLLVPGVQFALVASRTAEDCVELSVAGGDLALDPIRLPVGGLWGRSWRDGSTRYLADPAQDPGWPETVRQLLAGCPLAYLPVVIKGRSRLLLLAGFGDAVRFHDPAIRQLLSFAQALIARQLELESTEQALTKLTDSCQSAQRLIQRLGSEPLASLQEVLEQACRALTGIRSLRLIPGSDLPRRLTERLLVLPVKCGEVVGGYVACLAEEVQDNRAWLMEQLGWLGGCLQLYRRLVQAEQGAAAPQVRTVSLTDREREMAVRLARGESNRRIADDLHISERTVKAHVSSLLKKLQLPDRVAVAAWVAAGGLPQP